MPFRPIFSGRFALGCALWLLAASAPALTSGCTRGGQTAQQRKTERYKRQKAKSNHIPCPTHDC